MISTAIEWDRLGFPCVRLRFISSEMQDSVINWCNSNVGSKNWARIFDYYWFDSHESAVAFHLAWNGEHIKSPIRYIMVDS